MAIKLSKTEYSVLCLVAMAVQNPNLLYDYELEEDRGEYVLSYEEAEKLNQSVLNSGAGIFEKDPYFEWVSPKDKVKKSIDKFEPQLSSVGINDAQYGDTEFSYQQVMAEMSAAMAINVGTGYNMASALTAATMLFSHMGTAAVKLAMMELVTRKSWDVTYEDLALSQDYKRGNPFYKLLFESIGGVRSIPPASPEAEWTTKSPAVTNQDIRNMFQEATGVTLSEEEAKWFIWARRVVAGYKRLNKEGLEAFYKTRKNKPFHTGANSNLVSLFPASKEHSMLPDIVFVGVFRQLGQGTYGVDESEEDTQSLWELYGEYKKHFLPYLPNWLRRKMELAADLWQQMIDQKREERKHNERDLSGNNPYQLDTPDGEYEGLDIPYLDIHSCHGKSRHASGFIGAFQIMEYACPIKPMLFKEGVPQGCATKKDMKDSKAFMPHEEKDGRKVYTNGIAFVPRKLEEVPDMECKVSGGAYWYYRKLSAKEVIQKAAERYPNGVILFSENNNPVYQFIHFKSLLRFGAFAGGSSATGVALRLAQLIIATQQYPESRPSGWDSSAGGILRSITAGIRGMVGLSEGASTSGRSKIIRSVGRSSSAEGSYATKVMTSCAPRVQDYRFTCGNGTEGRLPVIVFSPNDDIIRQGGFKEGAILSVGRTPMISSFYAYLKLDESVSVGNAEVRASVFKKYTSGDGDGDPMGGRQVSIALA